MQDGEPWFVGKDVAKILGYAKPLNAIATHVDEDDSLKQGLTDSLGRIQETIIINESGLYSLILSSKLPDYYGAAEPPVRCGVSHLSGLTEPLH